MKRTFAILLVGGAVAASAWSALGQGRSVVDTVHNLSAAGPGSIRAVSEPEVCIFCHTAHRAAPVEPLWNRRFSAEAYTVYASSSLDARPGQPTGASKMCLSCHDGTIALGSVVSRDQVIQMSGGITTLPAGRSNLGTDLSDDHPISFRYDQTLANRDGRLVAPSALPEHHRLDRNGELQCTTCHDAHDDSRGAFLVAEHANGAMCTSCHTISTTDIPKHQDCASCHMTHTAPSGPYLLREPSVTATCLNCHDGSEHEGDIASEMQRASVHDFGGDRPISPFAPPAGGCTDCHDPHSMSDAATSAPLASPKLGRIAGMSIAGGAEAVARYEYEVCFRCHADSVAEVRPLVSRQLAQTNVRLEFASNAVSFHPVTGPGRNSDVPSLRPGWTESSLMSCSDCHGSDTSRKAGGFGPNGVHGSSEPPLLVARYDTGHTASESAAAYALCYRCHAREGRGGILSDASFPHSVHVRDGNAPCSVCHDPHGIASAQGSTRRNSHLINFDVRVVSPSAANGRLEFRDEGRFAGSCTLSCHGVEHVRTSYGN